MFPFGACPEGRICGVLNPLIPLHLSCYWNNISFFTREKDHLLYLENCENIKDTFSTSHHPMILPDEHLKMNPSNEPLSFPTITDPEALARRNTRVLSMHNPPTKDLLSGLCSSFRFHYKQLLVLFHVPVWRWDFLKGKRDFRPSCYIVPKRPLLKNHCCLGWIEISIGVGHVSICFVFWVSCVQKRTKIRLTALP